jgi:hypothetical protein
MNEEERKIVREEVVDFIDEIKFEVKDDIIKVLVKISNKICDGIIKKYGDITLAELRPKIKAALQAMSDLDDEKDEQRIFEMNKLVEIMLMSTADYDMKISEFKPILGDIIRVNFEKIFEPQEEDEDVEE